jgi:hypothetical protein
VRFAAPVGAFAILISLFVAACGSSSNPTAALTSGSHSAAASQPASSPRKGNETARTALSLNPSAFQAGVIVYADGNDPSLLISSVHLLDHLASLKVNAAALAFPLYQTSWTSTDVHADAVKTPSPVFIQDFIQAAHQRGLAVLLRPLIDDTPLMASGHWRGQLRPTNVDAWFASYRSTVLTYARVAQAQRAEVIDVGTELNSLQGYTAQWTAMIAAIRQVFSGQLTYSDNWDVAYPAFASSLDFVSVDAFYPLSAPFGATVNQLVAAWQRWTAKLSQLHSSAGKPVVLTELGTTSEAGSFQTPFNWQHGTGLSLEAQRRYYAASCAALKPMVGGMYWWVYYADYFDKIVGTTDPGYSPQGKPAEQEIASCYR